MSLSFLGERNILQNTFSMSNLPRRSFAKFVVSDIASSSFTGERFGGTIDFIAGLEIFNKEKLREDPFH